MKEKFTSGEWRVNHYTHGLNIASNKDSELITDYVYTEADAHLIAAAPKMYAMLEEAKTMLEVFHTNTGSIGAKSQAYGIEKLLAEARGEL